MTTYRTTFHHDGTITYWSVYAQQWMRHARTVPAQELASMATDERERVQRHLSKAISAAMAYLGSRTSPRKAASSAANGKLGGRPPKARKWVATGDGGGYWE